MQKDAISMSVNYEYNANNSSFNKWLSNAREGKDSVMNPQPFFPLNNGILRFFHQETSSSHPHSSLTFLGEESCSAAIGETVSADAGISPLVLSG